MNGKILFSRLIKSNTMNFLIFFIIIFLNLCFDCNANITTDGSLGSKTSIKGPSYDISHNLGKILGKNLFHSFLEFGLEKGETAIFNGPPDIQNIISRVTGNKESVIDGLLKSQIKGADFYFINPNGVILGKNAQIDIDGSFYISTADYIKFHDLSVFETKNPYGSSLTHAPPHSFGFLKKQSPSGIQINGTFLRGKESREINITSGDISIYDANIFVPSGNIVLNAVSEGEISTVSNHENFNKSFSLGNIHIIDSRLPQQKPSLWEGSSLIMGNLDSSGSMGKIQINAMDIYLDGSLIQLLNFGDYNSNGININTRNLLDMKNNAFILTGSFNKGKTGGLYIDSPFLVMNHSLIRGFNYISEKENININCKELLIKNSSNIESSSFGLSDGFNIMINSSDKIIIQDNYSGIASKIYNKGNAGDIDINTKELVLTDKAGIFSFSREDSTGRGARIKINSVDILIKDGAIIDNSTFGKASSGEIIINSKNSMKINGKQTGIFSLTGNIGNSGTIKINTPIFILDKGATISVTSSDKGDAGFISIDSDIVEIKNESYIDSTTLNEGIGGNITIKANKSILLSDSLPFGISSISNLKGNSGTILLETPLFIITNSAIMLSAYNNANAGNIFILTDNMIIKDNGYIDSSTFGNGKGGSIYILAKNSLDISSYNSGIFSMSSENGNAGTIIIETEKFNIKEGVVLTNTNGSGIGGNILINANKIKLSQNALISAESKGSGDAGDVSLISDKLFLNNAKIRASSDFSLGGNINLVTKDIRLNNNSSITATVATGDGNGGNVQIKSDKLVILDKSSITARADKGKGGNILVNSLVFLRDGELKKVLNASSNVVGNDGTVQINSPNLDISASMAVLSGFFLDVSGLLLNPCDHGTRENMSSLIIKECNRINFTPFDF